MITDLVQIRMLGEKKRKENDRFRRHLKTHGHSDLALRRIAEKTEDQIDCTQCANCCKVATVKLSGRDVERLARYLRVPPARFLKDYAEETAEEGLVLRRAKGAGCVFLSGTECTVYEARPDICQRFPHVVRGEGSIPSRMWQFIDRACYCPIVYNSLEAFKDETGFPR